MQLRFMNVSVLDFLIKKEPDFHGRMLADIWAFSDFQIEKTHNFIQWVFPTTTPSASVPGSPVLKLEEVHLIRQNAEALENLYRSAEWYLGFLERNTFWIKSHDHNHLRITRAIQSLRLLGDADEADYFKDQIRELIGARFADIPLRTRRFWEEA